MTTDNRKQINYWVIFDHYLFWNKKTPNSQFIYKIQYVYLQIIQILEMWKTLVWCITTIYSNQLPTYERVELLNW